MFLGPRDTSDLISMITFTFATRRHLIRLASGPFIPPSVWQSLVGFRLLTSVCNAYKRRSRTQNSRRVRENSGLILTRLWAKVHDFGGKCRRPLVLPNALARLRHCRTSTPQIPLGYSGTPQKYPFPWIDCQTPIPASFLDPSDL